MHELFAWPAELPNHDRPGRKFEPEHGDTAADSQRGPASEFAEPVLGRNLLDHHGIAVVLWRCHGLGDAM